MANRPPNTKPNGYNSESKLPLQSPVHGLVLVATPIGNAADISSRALSILRDVDKVACEDTRVTSRLFALHALKKPLLTYHDYNAARQRPKLIKLLKMGKTIALVSDAGMPTISDPGYKLVAACVDEGIAVSCIPGPSAVTTAIAVSGLPTDRFFFQGFLPAKKGQRLRVLAELKTIPGSIVVMESAQRLIKMLIDAHDCLGNRNAVITRELTKRFEEVQRGSLRELVQMYKRAGPPKGEVTVIIGPNTINRLEIDKKNLSKMLETAFKTLSSRDAITYVSKETKVPRRIVYQAALRLINKT
ncbi:MAG: 16S rRNA (cytidine(1402)-2'-O)-methyltransferase [Magnetovibrio sp.]|nr:16S rRNA (cytidine(1402)-2'-O)-methyltransferase [Magnetovibrio sp.]|tara:strand:+ start:1196 stop:2101 length:906 start_codon:yes stop_codon:yes gene_type:complete